MSTLAILALLIGLTIVPVMIGARVVGASNTGFGAALLAVIVLSAVSAAVQSIVTNNLAYFLVESLAAGIVIAVVLGTTFFRGLAVGIIVAVVQIAVMIVLAGAVIGTA